MPRPLAPSRARARGMPGPRGMRLAAVGLPALAAVVGALLPASRPASAAVRAGARLLPAGAVAVLWLARDPRRPASRDNAVEAAHASAEPTPAGDAATVTVLVPARDEAPVIARLVADLGAARSDPMSLIVIDDASCDGTAALACAAIRESGLGDVGGVIRLEAPSGSKGAALAAAPAPSSGVVVVLDADARVGPDFIAQARRVGAVSPVAQARRRMLRPSPRRAHAWARLLALVQDGEQELDGRLSRARLRVAGAAEFRGDGMVLQADVLRGLGGWPRDALCEDLEVSSHWYLATGRGVARPADLEVWEQPVLALRPLVLQRLRWAEGSIRRDIRVVLPAVADQRLPPWRRIEAGAYAAQALTPWAVLGLALRACTTAGHPSRADDGSTRTRASRTLRSLAAGYGLGALVLAWASLPERASTTSAAPVGSTTGAHLGFAGSAPLRADRIARALAVTVFLGLWPLLLPIAWLRVALRPSSPVFRRTPHEAPVWFSEPEPPLPPTT